MDDHFVKSIWPFEEVEFMVVDSVGSAGGLLCIWRPQIFELKSCCSGRNFIILSGISSTFFLCTLVNIYAPNEVRGRRQLWESLVSIHHHFPNPWCVGGDFNEIRYMGERKGCSSRDRGMKDFNEFVENMELTDLPLLGRQYTWCNALDGYRWSRIDRFLLDVKWLEKFSFKQWGLPRNHLRVWNKDVFGNIDIQLKKAEEELHEWDLKAESSPLQEADSKRKREVMSQVWQLSRRKERLWHQKSRQMWALSRDKNTRFFHIMASRRQRKNLIDSVVVEGRRVENPEQVKLEVVRYFSQLFSENWKVRPIIKGPFAVINPADAVTLEAELENGFSEEEVWEAVQDCDGNKAPGPDGFNLNCIQRCWPILK
ncbi:uncharacterized protein LOC114259414 [Camellia sinensis]|uniref:uncharacterized protein LOC114259414 n=1 Tax=Camellia sinensis TaxID=4442 RepID=UPI0010357B7D|nr:uncharacterized protein LOC114259414 [Camellia sinensis]